MVWLIIVNKELYGWLMIDGSGRELKMGLGLLFGTIIQKLIVPYTVGVKKTVTFSFRSVPLERKRNARSRGKKRSVPFPETVIERWAAPHVQLFINYRFARALLNSCLAV